jgi:hypothetical protein
MVVMVVVMVVMVVFTWGHEKICPSISLVGE